MATVWDEWRDVTRFLESARIAFARESNLWQSLELKDPASVGITSPTGDRRYEVSLEDHLAAMQNEQILLASVLIHSYALAEATACRALNVESRVAGGIESWGQQLLSRVGATWSDVHDGKPGAVEVAVVRNAFAHATRAVGDSDSKRLMDAGAPARKVGELVTLDHESVRLYRDRLRSLLRIGTQRRPESI